MSGVRIRFEHGQAVVERKWSRYPLELRDRARELLAGGDSLNAVKRATGISLGVLSLVRRGLTWQKDKHRCKVCGGLVYGECRACKIRSQR